MAEQKLNVLLDKLVQVKISFENGDQNKFKTKKFWCDQHQYNPFHETKDCNFNKLNLTAKLHKAMKDNVVVQNAIKSALASYDGQNVSNVSVVPAVNTVTDTPAQQISVQDMVVIL